MIAGSRPWRFAVALGWLAATPAVVASQDPVLKVPSFALPPSNQLSAGAKAVLIRMKAETAPDLGGDIGRQRAFYQRWNDRRLAEMHRRFATVTIHRTIGGVGVDVVTPRSGVPPRNARRLLINVHGGAFMWGAGSGALVEAIPIAATMGVTVVTVDYRLAPENRFPAASQDVAAVYRVLLRTYRPANIGIYGCSAGGVITAQSVAWFRKIGLPRPGAIGTFCGTGAPFSGDSAFLAGPTTGDAPLASTVLPMTLPSAYMDGVATGDSLAYPMNADEEVRAFPPTLMIAGGRDFAVSALTLAHRRFAQAGVPSDLYLFDGLPHAFFMWPDMPESLEAYTLIARFFDAHLGRAAR